MSRHRRAGYRRARALMRAASNVYAFDAILQEHFDRMNASNLGAQMLAVPEIAKFIERRTHMIEGLAQALRDSGVFDEPALYTPPTPIGREQYGNPVWPSEVELVHGRHPDAGEFGKLCYRTVCQKPEAVFYNRGSLKFYCADCAHELNKANWDIKFQDGRPMVVRVNNVDEAKYVPTVPLR